MQAENVEVKTGEDDAKEQEIRELTLMLDQAKNAYDLLLSALELLMKETEKRGWKREPNWYKDLFHELFALKDHAEWINPWFIEEPPVRYFLCRTCQMVTNEAGSQPHYCSKCSRSLGA